ncbi:MULTISPECIES: Dot/Icm T4SS effector VpdC [unclassified Legionella]|uniref:Dot/Icm T4SS effector VpdC n=1 Tax=unclassified Legionella TaxID=2622702 RepID=UPI001056B8B1|nr:MULTISPECIES: Dot/Icm T4SS effector VpdC [unclassified Legionella]MDI9818773.1 patatin-like phospholipase family protein [Legionella sp. PL877]
MPREDVLSALLRKDIVHYPNILLLKKFLLTVHLGWFRINGMPPDSQYSLGDYLLDDERIILDFTRMSERVRDKFLRWFIKPHDGNAHMAFLSGVATNNYRGYTAEVELSWWGRVTNLLFYKKKSYHWYLAPLEFSFNYQLTGMEICQDEHGLLIGLNQFSVEDKGLKYHHPEDGQVDPLRNAKRVFLTDKMVESLMVADIESYDFDSIIYKPHPFSIHVSSNSQRMKAMKEYRETQRLFSVKPWYLKLLSWIKSWFLKIPESFEMKDIRLGNREYQPILERKNIQVFRRANDGQILVIEKRPELDSMVFCGGGAKIFAHVGALKAFEEAGIKPANYAGSSAGAIMIVLCYLGCSSEEILDFFQKFKQENLIHYEIDRSGLSDARAVKAALDYMITKKVNAIITKYKIDKTPEGKRFLTNSVLKNGKISFKSLHLLKTHYPDCGLGDKLIVTATNVPQRKTRYFSYTTTPDMEVSEAVKTSASFPIVFKPTLLDGELHNDGGVLSNFPTEAFRGDLSTLLESEHGNCLSMVAFQFDNGKERSLLDKLADRVYRENFIWNWIYGLLTGVKDPVSGWERDRLKLLQHSNQVVLIPINNISATQFNIGSNEKTVLIDNGYQAAKNYLTVRYQQTANSRAINEEYMYSSFGSIEELLCFCCYRGHADWFEYIASEAESLGVYGTRIEDLRQQYFSSFPKKETVTRCEKGKNITDSFTLQFTDLLEKQRVIKNMTLFEVLYPVFQSLPCAFIKNPQDLKLFKFARHSLCLARPLAGLKHLKLIQGETHVLVSIFIHILTYSRFEQIEETTQKLKLLGSILQKTEPLNHVSFWGKWNLLPRQVSRVLKEMDRQQWSESYELCSSLKEGDEPLETFNIKEPELEDIPVDNFPQRSGGVDSSPLPITGQDMFVASRRWSH